MSKENSELVMLRLNYDIEKLKHFLYLAEQSQKEAVEIIAELKAENKKLKEKLETRCYNEVEFENKKLKEKLARIERILENNLDLFDVYRWDLGTYLLEIIRGEE